jgi:hypothetical protein
MAGFKAKIKNLLSYVEKQYKQMLLKHFCLRVEESFDVNFDPD